MTPRRPRRYHALLAGSRLDHPFGSLFTTLDARSGRRAAAAPFLAYTNRPSRDGRAVAPAPATTMTGCSTDLELGLVAALPQHGARHRDKVALHLGGRFGRAARSDVFEQRLVLLAEQQDAIG